MEEGYRAVVRIGFRRNIIFIKIRLLGIRIFVWREKDHVKEA